MKKIKSVYSDEKLRHSVSEKISSSLLKSEFFLNADFVFSYIPKFPEADCSFVNEFSLESGKKLFVPRVIPSSTEMEFFEIENGIPLARQIEKGSFGIYEPLRSLKTACIDSEDGKKFFENKKILMVVPGAAFSKDGKRLGRGKGFYDRYIPRLKKVCRNVFLCGFCYPEQIETEIPCGKFDVKMDSVCF